MAYRGDDAGDVLEAPTAEGPLRVSLGPNRVELAVAHRTLHIAGRIATLVEDTRKKDRSSLRLDGRLVVARDVPHEDLGIWVELVDEPKKKPTRPKVAKRQVKPAPEEGAPEPAPSPASPMEGRGMRRIFGVEPVSLLEPDGLGALRRLDQVAQRLRAALGELAGDVRRAVEVGRGLDKVLLADHGDRYVVYARRLFRDRARFAMAVHADGRIQVPDGDGLREVQVTSRFGVTVRGDYVRFADRHGTDLARVSIPWISPEDRAELARRIGQLVDRA